LELKVGEFWKLPMVFRRTAVQRKTVAISILLVAILAFGLRHSNPGSSPGTVELYIGSYVGAYSGERAALQCLATEIRRHPNAQKFVINWSESWLAWFHCDEAFDRHSIHYERQTHRLWVGDYGGSWGQDGVSDQIVSDVAKAHGVVDDMKRYGCQAYP
jgi:hypothetical protein